MLLPTDTVYGLCIAPERAGRLSQLKGRFGAPVALLAADAGALLEAVPELPADKLLTGAYTLVLPNPAGRFPALGGGATIGVRLPELPSTVREVVTELGVVAATSANLHGEPDPSRLDDVPRSIRDACAAEVDAGELPGTPSTVIDLTGPEPVVLREGAGSVEEALQRLA